jgi:tRNA G18 (ribose-2'-O)-methylase SpoU
VGLGSADAFGPKAVRASAGAVLRIPVVEGPLDEALTVLHAGGCTTWLAEATGAVAVEEADLAAPTAVVLGNEARGPARDLRATITRSLRIPMAEGAESLNVAMAGTLVLFEAARQRRTAGGDGDS